MPRPCQQTASSKALDEGTLFAFLRHRGCFEAKLRERSGVRAWHVKGDTLGSVRALESTPALFR